MLDADSYLVYKMPQTTVKQRVLLCLIKTKEKWSSLSKNQLKFLELPYITYYNVSKGSQQPLKTE